MYKSKQILSYLLFLIVLVLVQAFVYIKTGNQIFIFLICVCSVLLLGIFIFYFKKVEKQFANLVKESELQRKKIDKINKEAEQKTKNKNAFLSNMSHEIRNSINSIIGILHILRDTNLEKKQIEYVQIIYDSSMALLGIVNNTLDLSKIQAGKLKLDIIDFDIAFAIKDMMSSYKIIAEQKGINFFCVIEPDVPCLLKADIGSIRQILSNLIGNSIKFTEAGSIIINISLESETEKEAILNFSVEDTGIGIQKDKISELFQSFVQADDSIYKKYGGTGLGLAITKLLVEMMGGKIGADSIEMVGSTFWFTLPLEKQSAKKISLDFANSDISGCRVLVLTENVNMEKDLETNLKDLEISYEHLYSTNNIVEMFQSVKDISKPFHIMLMEITKFNESFKNIVRQIKKIDFLKYTKFIILKSVGKRGDGKFFEDLGFSAYLSKPVGKELLEDCIKAVLSLPKNITDLPIITKYFIIETKKRISSVLIVEDLETNLLIIKSLLIKQGYQVCAARNGLEAVEKYKQNKYDLIVMDINLSGMDGLQVTQKIREFEKENQKVHTPIIAMTANIFEKDKKACFDAGMDDFIAKPIEPEILLKKISSMLFEKSSKQIAKKLLKAGGRKDYSETGKETDTKKTEQVVQIKIDKIDKDLSCKSFNQEDFFGKFGGDEETADMIMELFFEEASELLENINAAIKANDIKNLRLYLHTLQGSASNMHSDLFRNTIRDMEENIENKQLDNLVLQVVQLKKEYDNFMNEVKIC